MILTAFVLSVADADRLGFAFVFSSLDDAHATNSLTYFSCSF
jgi:hypothetical protein